MHSGEDITNSNKLIWRVATEKTTPNTDLSRLERGVKSCLVTSSARVDNNREEQALNILEKVSQHLRNRSYFGVQQTSKVAKWTVSLPADLARFVERYQQTHALESRSEVIAQSLRTLQEAELAQAYRNHAAECKSDPEREFWDSAAVADGLEEG